MERIGLDRQVRDRNGKAGSVQRTGKVGKVATRNGEVRSGEAAAARIVFERHGVVR